MKVIPTEFEPQVRAGSAKEETPVAITSRRRSRVMLMPVVADTRLFHAL